MWCFYSPCVLFACLRPHVWLSCVLDLVSLIKWHRMWMNPGSVHRLWNIPASKRICMKRVLGFGPIINRIQFFNNQLYLFLPFQLRTCPDIWTSFTYEFQKLFRESGHDIARSCLFLNAAHNRQWEMWVRCIHTSGTTQLGLSSGASWMGRTGGSKHDTCLHTLNSEDTYVPCSHVDSIRYYICNLELAR